MSETADELRQRMKEARISNGRQRLTDLDTNSRPSDSSNDPESNSRVSGTETQSSDRPEERHANSSDSEVREPVKPVRRRANSNQGHNSTASNPQRELAGSTGSVAQIDRRAGSSDRRPSQDHPTYRPDGIDVRTGVSGQSGSVIPTIVGNLQRNIDDERSIFIPPRSFAEEAPTVGQPALIIGKDGKPTARELKGIKKDGARAVEAVKAVIPKAKRGRTPRGTDTQNVLYPNSEPPAKVGLKDKLKEAGQAIPKGNKLTAKEIDELREPLQQALSDEFGMIDQLLWKYEGEESLQQPIWSDINDPEMEKLVNAILNMGTRSATVATIARASVDMSDYIIAGTLLAPRLQATASLVGEVRRKKSANKVARTRGRR